MRTDVAAIIPAYQAGVTVGAVVAGARVHCATVLVVDDGSTDDTAQSAIAAGAEVLRHPANAGKGAALRTGLAALAGRGIARGLTLDADGQHLAEEIPVLLEASDRAPEAIVVGVRLKKGHAIARANRIGNWVADRLLRAIAGRPLPDTQCGFRIYPVGTTLALGAEGPRYEFETEVLLRAARRGVDVIGVPVRVHYPPIAERVSHFRPWRDTLRIIGIVVRLLVRGAGPAVRPAPLAPPKPVPIRAFRMKGLLALIGGVVLLVVVYVGWTMYSANKASTSPVKEIATESITRTGDTWHIAFTARFNAPVDKVFEAYSQPERSHELVPDNVLKSELVKQDGNTKVVDIVGRLEILPPGFKVQNLRREITLYPAEHRITTKSVDFKLADISSEYKFEPTSDGKGTLLRFTQTSKDKAPMLVESLQKGALRETFAVEVRAVDKALGIAPVETKREAS